MGRAQSGQICVLEIRVLWPRQQNLSRLDWSVAKFMGLVLISAQLFSPDPQ
jgi:hypothetical protein